jgi:mannose-6-phosphate isomerase class I
MTNKVTSAVSNETANYPYLVQVKNTENWNTVQAYPDDSQGASQAWCRAEGLALAYPKLPVRVLHCIGGKMDK